MAVSPRSPLILPQTSSWVSTVQQAHARVESHLLAMERLNLVVAKIVCNYLVFQNKACKHKQQCTEMGYFVCWHLLRTVFISTFRVFPVYDIVLAPKDWLMLFDELNEH